VHRDAGACTWMPMHAHGCTSVVLACLKNIDWPPSLMRIHAAWICPGLMCIHAPWMCMLLDFCYTPNFIPNWPKTVGPLISDLGPYSVFAWPPDPTLPCPYPMTECHPSRQQVHHTAFSAFSSSLAHGTLNLAPAMTLHHSPGRKCLYLSFLLSTVNNSFPNTRSSHALQSYQQQCVSPPSPENLNTMRRPSVSKGLTFSSRKQCTLSSGSLQ
jgi:hypothetical protein